MRRRAGPAAGTPPVPRTRPRCRPGPAVRASAPPRRSRPRTPRRGRPAASPVRSRKTRSVVAPAASTCRHDPDVVAGRELRLAGAGGEFQQRVRRPRWVRNRSPPGSARTARRPEPRERAPWSAPDRPTGCRSRPFRWTARARSAVVTAPPEAFWKGMGTSTCWRLGHSQTAPASTATPIAASSPTTILAGSGSRETGPDDKASASGSPVPR